MNRRKFLTDTAVFSVAIAGSALPSSACLASGRKATGSSMDSESRRLSPPTSGKIPVAFVISQNATVIDFTGPWEVFQDVMLGDPGDPNHRMPFQLYTVSASTDPITATDGLKIVPSYSFDTAPAPKVVVVPAQSGVPAMYDWLRKHSVTADVTMSVCTGAFQLAKAGLLSGKKATTHHLFTDRLARMYPDIHVERGVRFVEGDKISTAGGLTSGIDLSLRVVDRYFGREVAQKTADYMEYRGDGWKV